MPWKSPSSQPTSWAWAIRSSPSDGVPSSVKGSDSRSSSSTSSGASPASSSLIEACVDLLEAVAAGLVEGRGLHLLEELADHAADPHHLGRLLDQLGDVALAVAVLVVTVAGGLRHRRQRARRDGADGLAVGTDDHDLLLACPWPLGPPVGSGCCCSVMVSNPMTRPVVTVASGA